MLEIFPHTIAALCLIALYPLYILASRFVPVAGNDSFPIVDDGGRRIFFSGIRQRWYWFKNGPKIIHDAYRKVCETPNSFERSPGKDNLNLTCRG
jgi:hypothetical protein